MILKKKFIIILFLICHYSFSQTVQNIDKELQQLTEYDIAGDLNTVTAIKKVKSCYEASRTINYNRGAVRSGIFLARLLLRKQDYYKAIEITDDVLKSTDPSFFNAEDISELYRFRGLSYGNLGFIDKSYSEYKTALTFSNNIQDNDRRHLRNANLYENMTSYFDQKKVYPDSIRYFLQKSLDEALMIKTNSSLPMSSVYSVVLSSYCNLGLYYSEISEPKNMTLAEKNFQQALKVFYKGGKMIRNIDKVTFLDCLSRFYFIKKMIRKLYYMQRNY